MKNLFSLLIILFIVNGAMAQWVQQISGTTRDLNSVYFTNVNIGYAVGDNGTILKTTDGGANWEIQSSGIVSDLNTVQFPVADTGYIGCADDTAVLKTTNGGSTWISKSLGISGGLRSVYFVNPDLGYALNLFYIFKTTNGGDQWSSIYTETAWRHYLGSLFFPDANNGYVVGSILLHPMDEFAYVLKTNDGGIYWANIYESISGYETLNSLYFNNADTGYVVGDSFNECLILKTTNGGTEWTTTNLVSDRPELYSVYFTDANTGYVVGKCSQGGIIYKTINGGADWVNQTSGTGNPLYSVHFPSMDTGYIVGANGTILKTSNGGYVGINDHRTIANTLIVYPNPSSDKISITTFAKGSLSILALNGEELLKEEITATKTQLDISNLSSGVYFLKVAGERTVQVVKLIKN